MKENNMQSAYFHTDEGHNIWKCRDTGKLEGQAHRERLLANPQTIKRNIMQC
jgi:hypothetical protein